MPLRKSLEIYRPDGAQEIRDRQVMLEALDVLLDPLSRENPFAHFTASAWIVNADRTRVLMAYHNIYRAWAWTGGHADGDGDLLRVALREAKEETGLREIWPISGDIFSLEVLPVFSHIRRGEFVSSHLHLNVTYLLGADERQEIRAKPDENSAVAWLPLEEAADCREEPCMGVIYRKLNQKLQNHK